MEYYDETNPIKTQSLNSILTNTFFRMFLGLLATAITAFYTYSSGMYLDMIYNGYFSIIAIVELVVVIVFSLLFKKLSPSAVTILFFAYAFLNGFSLSVIFAKYQISTISYAFLATAALFGALAFIGYKTEKDISNWGTILTVLLFVGMILTIINLFLKSSTFDIVLDWAILFIFFGLIIYDTNKIKRMQEMAIVEEEKLYIYGAMELYLDFINIFLKILRSISRQKR